MIYPAVIYLMDLGSGRSRELLIAVVMACGFLIFYALPDGIPFLVRLTMMVAVQFAVGKALQREEMR